MLNKKVLLSLLFIGVVAAASGSGTWAYYSAGGTSSSNVLTAGTLDLTMESTFSIDLVDVTDDFLVPGETATGSVIAQNTGNVPGDLYVKYAATGPLVDDLTVAATVDNVEIQLSSTVWTKVADLGSNEQVELGVNVLMPTDEIDGMGEDAQFTFDVILMQDEIAPSSV